MTNPGKPAVTVLGLGAMGAALAEAVLAAGHPTTVWNRTAARADPLVAKGAVRAGTAAEAIAASRLVVVCLLDHGSVLEVLGDGAAALPGRVVVDTTNGTPGQAREVAAWLAERDAAHLDGGIMAVPPMIGTPAAFVLYSGSRGAFDTYREVLDAFGESRYLGPDHGLAALHDLALLSGMYGLFSGVLHAFALIRSGGVEATAFAPVLGRWLDAMGGFTAGAAAQVDSGDYTDDVVSTLAMQAAAYANLDLVAAEQGVSPELLAPLGALMRRRVADGHGRDDLASVVELLTTDQEAGR